MTATQASRNERKRSEINALSFPVTSPRASEEAMGETATVAEGVLQARIPMPMELDHINVYLLRDDDGWWLIDTGLNLDASKRCWEAIAANAEVLEGLPFKALICTHFHHDHAGLAHWLVSRFNIPLYMSFGEYSMLRMISGGKPPSNRDTQLAFYRQAGVPEDKIASLLKALDGFPGQPDAPDSFHRLRDGQHLEIGGRRWQVVIGEGHAPEHACLYAPDDRLLVAGDQVLPYISSNVMVGPIEPEADPMSDWLASLERLAGLDPETLVMPAHGDVFRNLPGRVEQLQNHHGRQFDCLRAFASTAGPFTPFEAMGALFPQELAGAQILLALGETIAHLTWLTRHGELRRSLEEGGHVYQRRAQVSPVTE